MTNKLAGSSTGSLLSVEEVVKHRESHGFLMADSGGAVEFHSSAALVMQHAVVVNAS